MHTLYVPDHFLAHTRDDSVSDGPMLECWTLLSALAGHATGHLLRLFARHVPAEEAVPLDDLDPLRRFERAYPGLGSELNSALARDPLEAALTLLDLAERGIAQLFQAQRKALGW